MPDYTDKQILQYNITLNRQVRDIAISKLPDEVEVREAVKEIIELTVKITGFERLLKKGG